LCSYVIYLQYGIIKFISVTAFISLCPLMTCTKRR